LYEGVIRDEGGRARFVYRTPAWLDFEVRNDGAVCISFGMTGGLPEAAGTLWLAFAQTAAIGGAESASLRIPECDSELVADLRLQDGSLWLAPRAGTSSSRLPAIWRPIHRPNARHCRQPTSPTA